jgi:hypothetical protein
MSRDDFRRLIEGFAAGNEFIDLRNNARTAGLPATVPLPRDLHPLEIDTPARAGECAQCAAKISGA